jgi:hypothetical protein
MPVLPVRMSNGCDWGRCLFCQESADRGALSSSVVYQEPATRDTVQNLRALHERWGASVFINASSTLTARGCIALGEALGEAKLPVHWMSMVRAEKAFAGAGILACAAGGARALNFGVESFHPQVNQLMRKGVDWRRTGDILQRCHESGILVTCYTMVDFPGETLEHYTYHLAQLEQHMDCIDFLFQSVFMLIVAAPVFRRRERYGIELDAGRMSEMLGDMFPIYLVPDDAYRRPSHQLGEKLDRYYSFLARLIRTRPLYFDRDFEIVARHPYWEPEYNLIASQLESRTRLPGLSLSDMLASEVALANDVTVERLDASRYAVTLGRQDLVYYYPRHLGLLLVELRGGASFRAAFDRVVEQVQPTDRDVVELYERVHRDLRYLGALQFASPTHSGRVLAVEEAASR